MKDLKLKITLKTNLDKKGKITTTPVSPAGCKYVELTNRKIEKIKFEFN